jgi:hypothetical protein
LNDEQNPGLSVDVACGHDRLANAVLHSRHNRIDVMIAFIFPDPWLLVKSLHINNQL